MNTQYQTNLENLHYRIIPTSDHGCDNDSNKVRDNCVCLKTSLSMSLNLSGKFYQMFDFIEWYPAISMFNY